MMTSKEALEALKSIRKFDGGDYYSLGDKKEFKIIGQDLDRLEKLEKAMNILKNKQVDLAYLITFIDNPECLRRYNYWTNNQKLTQEEFDLLKEMLEICQK